MSERHRRLFFVALFALVFYLVGASFVESFVTYPTWRLVGSQEFRAYYHELASRIVRIMVLPGVLEIPLCVCLVWLRPRAIPRWPVAIAIILNLVRFASTAIGQTQLQATLETEALSLDAIDRLRRIDYVAQAASIGRAVLFVWMMSLVVGEKDRLAYAHENEHTH
jgi:hypothetical protein